MSFPTIAKESIEFISTSIFIVSLSYFLGISEGRFCIPLVVNYLGLFDSAKIAECSKLESWDIFCVLILVSLLKFLYYSWAAELLLNSFIWDLTFSLALSNCFVLCSSLVDILSSCKLEVSKEDYSEFYLRGLSKLSSDWDWS